ncbi:MAG: glycosyltransferase family 4 protein, partial [Pseudomonadota bacterium]|nr:glycosyltransferase family 4 protein [Pseudomonadota bacterium]
TFFHNVEAKFFLDSFKRRKSVRAGAVLIANYLAERNAVRFSNRLIALSERDSKVLKRIYGRAATDILPLAMEDALDPITPAQPSAAEGSYVLFVGGAFYANEAGITWFADEVAPHIGLRICIVGQGMERLRDRLALHSNVEIVGRVDRLQDWYLGAKVVVAPIFDGSGMKTKVAEALMFGKKVVGTSEAFAGYEDVVDRAGWLCNTKEEFVSTLRSLEAKPLSTLDPSLREIYEHNYSKQAALRRLSHILA